MTTRRQLGGGLVAVGVLLLLLGLYDLADEFWPDGQGPTAQALLDLLALTFPGLPNHGAGGAPRPPLIESSDRGVAVTAVPHVAQVWDTERGGAHGLLGAGLMS